MAVSDAHTDFAVSWLWPRAWEQPLVRVEQEL